MQPTGFLRRCPIRATLVLVSLCLPLWTAAAGSWTTVQAPYLANMGHMLLLSDGSVMAQNYAGNAWYRLTPDAQGHYIHGTWTNMASMHYNRLYYSSDVLPDGRVFVAGAEYGNGTTNAEIYDPLRDTWTEIPVPDGLITTTNTVNSKNQNSAGFIDSPSIVLSNGKVLVAPIKPATNLNTTLIFDPCSNAWSTATSAGNQNEASWVKLPDDTILTIDKDTAASERFFPGLNAWLTDAPVGISLYSTNNEIGAAMLLPDGRAFFIGGNGHTAFYTPSGGFSFGTWTQGPDLPNGMVMQDAPAAMLPNGKILCAVSAPANHQPVYFYEYDWSSNSFNTNVPGPTGGSTDVNTISDETSMLLLPDGTVLFSDSTFILSFYQPDGVPLASAKPSISSIGWNYADGSLLLSGTQFNGLSQGSVYGDEAQQDSNFPLAWLTDSSGNVLWGRTYNWSSTGVRTGNRLVTTRWTLPANLAPGSYSLSVVANGVSSDPVTFYGPVWVDFNSTIFIQLGTELFPYQTLGAGVNAVDPGGTIALKPGHSAETMTISKPMTIIAVGGAATIGQ